MGDKAEQFLLLARSARGRAACDLISRCTSEPGLFTFGEILEAPSIADVSSIGRAIEAIETTLAIRITISSPTSPQLKAGDHAAHHRLLELFAFGTYSDYKGVCGRSCPAAGLGQTARCASGTISLRRADDRSALGLPASPKRGTDAEAQAVDGG